MTEQLYAVEIDDLVQQGSQPTPLPQQRNGLGKLHLVKQFSEADHVAAATAAVAVEQVFVWVNQKAGFMVRV
jgi:hypothetical protein